jgi:hypothetical protein
MDGIGRGVLASTRVAPQLSCQGEIAKLRDHPPIRTPAPAHFRVAALGNLDPKNATPCRENVIMASVSAAFSA